MENGSRGNSGDDHVACDLDQQLNDGRRHLARGDLRAAVTCFGGVLLRDRSNAAALRGLGRCALLDGHLDTADLCFARAESISRGSGDG